MQGGSFLISGVIFARIDAKQGKSSLFDSLRKEIPSRWLINVSRSVILLCEKSTENVLLQNLHKYLTLLFRLPNLITDSFLKQIGHSGCLVFFDHKRHFN